VNWLPSPLNLIVGAFLNVALFSFLFRTVFGAKVKEGRTVVILSLAVPAVFNVAICLLKAGFTPAERLSGLLTTFATCVLLYRGWRARNRELML
jgi:hypothetical protein